MSAPTGSVGPLPVLATGALAGARGGLWLELSAGAWVAAAAAGLAAVVASRLARGPALRLGAATLGLVVCTAALAGFREARLESGPLWQLAAEGSSRQALATVVSEPRPGGEGWWTLVRVERIGGIATRERALLRSRADEPPPLVGSVWQGQVTAHPLDEDGFGAYLRHRHTAVAVAPRGWRPVAPPTAVLRLVESARERVREAAAHRLPAASAGLAAGLVTGDTRLLPGAVADAMQETGLSHLTAVSGSNVAIVVAGALWTAGALGLGARGRRRLVVVTICGFAVLTRLEPSVLRASVMALVVVAGQVRGVGRDARHDLAAALLLLVLADPMLAASVGLILSAAATAGVLMLAPLVARRLSWLPPRIRDVLAVTVGAQVAVAPVLLATHGRVPLASVPANLVAVPAAVLASVVSGLSALVAMVHPAVGGLGFWVAAPPLAVIRWSARVFHGAPGTISWERPVLLLVALAACWWLLARSGSGSARFAATVGVTAALLLVVRPLVPARPPRGLTVTAIDVGQGDAVLIRAPGAAVLVDAGADDTAAGWLETHGPRALDLVVVSHPHEDHVGGLPEVLSSLQTGTVWYRPVSPALGSVDRLSELAAPSGTVVAAPTAGQRARVGQLLIEVLGPPPGRPYRFTDSEANNTSIVLAVSWRGRRALLTGDIEEPAQQDLLGRPGRLRAGVLKVPHHGAATSETGLFGAVGATDAVISVGADNPYGHPDPYTLAALRRSGAEVHRTDRDGTVRLVVPATSRELGRRRDQPAVAAATPPRSGRGLRRPATWTGHRHPDPMPAGSALRDHTEGPSGPRARARSPPGGGSRSAETRGWP